MLLSICALAATMPATVASTPHPRWESAKYGLFVHHVFGGSLQGMTPLGPQGGFPKDLDSFAEAFDVNRFADSVKAMGFEYVIFTGWHFGMNVLYPSQRMEKWRGPGHATSRRDLLGEIMDALRKRGIMPALYSHVFVGHEFRDDNEPIYYSYDRKDGVVTKQMRRTGYWPAASAPWGPQPPPPETRLWNDFINDIYDEMAARYGSKVEAMYFDGSWAWMIDRARVMNTIRKHNPRVALIANGTADHGFPYASKEVGSPDGKDYGFASDAKGVQNQDARTWPGYRRHVALIAGANWWAAAPGGPQFSVDNIVRYTVLQASTSDGGGIGWSFGTYADGSFESGLEDRFRAAWKQMQPYQRAIRGTIRSRAYPTAEHQTLQSLRPRFVATESADGRRTFLHVLNPPPDGVLDLPAPNAGIRFWTARRLGGPGKVRLIPRGTAYELILNGNWGTLNTVIELEHAR